MVGMFFILPVCLWGLHSVQIQNEFQKWIPDRLPEQQTAGWASRHFPPDDIVLLTWEESGLADPRVDRLVGRIRGTEDANGSRRGGSKLIDHVVSPHELIARMERCEVSRNEALDRLAGILIGAGPLRVQLTETGRARRDKVIELIRDSARATLGDEAVVTRAEVSASGLPADEPLPETPGVREAGDVEPLPPHDLTIGWPGMLWQPAKKAALIEILEKLHFSSARSREPAPRLVEKCFQHPGAPIALAIYLSESGRADRNGALRELVSLAGETGIPADTIHIAGKPVVSAALDDTIRSPVGGGMASQILRRPGIGLVLGAGFVITFWLLKSVRLTAIVVLVSCFTTLVSMALVPVTGGAFDIVLAILPTFIFVTSLAAAVGMASGWRESIIAEERARSTAAIKQASFVCLVAGVSLALGAASLLASSLAPIRQFGLYAASGTLVSLLVTLYGLPALLEAWGGRPVGRQVSTGPMWRALAAGIAGRSRSICGLALVALAMAWWWLASFQTESRAIRHFSEDSRTVRDYEFVEERLAGVLPVDVIVRFDRESQQQLKFLQRGNLIQQIESEIRKLPEISGTLSLADFLPAMSVPGDHANMRERARYNAASRTIETRVKVEEQAAARPLLEVADDASEFNAEGDELWRITAQAAMLSVANYRELRGHIDDICCAALRGISGSTADKVPPVGRNRNYHPGASHVIAGDIPISVATQAELKSSFQRSLAIEFVLLTLMAIVVVRHPWIGLVTMLPSLLAVGVTFALTSLCGLRLDIGLTMAAPVALALAGDGTLRLVRGLRTGLLEQKGRTHALAYAMAQFGPAAWQSTIVIGVGLATLCASDLILISRFGWMTMTLVVACFMANIILTPALFAGPFGRMLEQATPINPRPETVSTPAGEEALVPARLPAEIVPGQPHMARKGVRIRRVD